MTQRRREPFPFAHLIVNLIFLTTRLAFGLVGLVLRIICWILLHMCLTIEGTIDWLKREPAKSVPHPAPKPMYQSPARPFVHAVDTPARSDTDLAQFMKAIGTKDKALAERLFAQTHRKNGDHHS